MPPLNILISGAGIAGTILAYLLSESTDCTITVIERFPRFRNTGQNIDIRAYAVDIIQRLGLEQAVRDKSTTETGLRYVDAKGKVVAEFPMTGDTKQQSLTSEFEILRGDLAEILWEKSRGSAEYVFGDWITGVEEEGGKVGVTTANGKISQGLDWDLLLAGDGLMSSTRRLVFGRGPKQDDHVRSLGMYLGYFTIPKTGEDDSWAYWGNSDRGRMVTSRPDNYGTRRVILGVCRKDLQEFEAARTQGPEVQKALLKKEFESAEWMADRVVTGLDSTEAEDFYFSPVAQVKIERFVKGRVALLGDAGFCPSPVSGMGTTTAIISAYVLAGEISETPNEIVGALERYQSAIRPFVDQAQSLPPGVPDIANPQTNTGIWIMGSIYRVISSKLIRNFFLKLVPAFSGKRWTPRRYEKLEKIA